MLIARQCKVPRIGEDWRLFQNKEEIEVRSLPDNFVVNGIAAQLVGCYEARPHIDDNYHDFFFVTLVAQSYHHALSDATAYPRQWILKKGDLVIIDPDELHWLYQTPESSSRFRRRGYWLGIQWEVPKDDDNGGANGLRHFVTTMVDQFHGQWSSRYDAGRYGLLLPS